MTRRLASTEDKDECRKHPDFRQNEMLMAKIAHFIDNLLGPSDGANYIKYGGFSLEYDYLEFDEGKEKLVAFISYRPPKGSKRASASIPVNLHQPHDEMRSFIKKMIPFVRCCL